MAHRISLGDLLVRAGVLEEEKLNLALNEQKRWGGRIGKILVDMNFISEDILVKAISKQLSIPIAELDNFDVPRFITKKIEQDYAREHSVVPLRVDPKRKVLYLAMADPIDVKLTDEIGRMTGYRVEPSLAGERAISHALPMVYGASMEEPPVDPHESVAPRELPPSLELLPVAASFGVDDLSNPPSARPSAGQVVRTSHPESAAVPIPSTLPESTREMVKALESAQKKQLRAIRTMIDLMVERGIFSREEYLAELNRR